MAIINDTTIRHCRKCGEDKPVGDFYTSYGKPKGHCKPCRKERDKEYRAKNRDMLNEKNRVWRENNKDRHRENARNWARRNKGRVKANQEKWAAENRDKVRGYGKKWYAANSDKVLSRVEKYRAENADWFREYNRLKSSARRARERGNLTVKFTKDQLAQRIAYYGGKCWVCGVAEYEHLDHVKPVAKGGAHILANLRPACASCNQSKNAAWPFPLTKGGVKM